VTEWGRLGEEPFGDSIELDFYLSRGCGHCGWRGLFDPMPREYVPGRWSADNTLEEFPVIYRCESCGKLHLAAYKVVEGEDGRASLTGKPAVAPTPKAMPLQVPELRGTVIEAYRDEAWACAFASHHRAALVLARSALQALCRRYLPKKKWSKVGLGPEVAEMERLVGTGWKAVGDRVKALADKWAHPGPLAVDSPTAKETRSSLQFMDETLKFTAVMERAGHIKPARWVTSRHA